MLDQYKNKFTTARLPNAIMTPGFPNARQKPFKASDGAIHSVAPIENKATFTHASQKTSLLTLDDGRSCRETRLLAEQKLAAIETRIRDLSRMRRLLEGLVAECAQGRRPRACPIITTLMSGA